MFRHLSLKYLCWFFSRVIGNELFSIVQFQENVQGKYPSQLSVFLHFAFLLTQNACVYERVCVYYIYVLYLYVYDYMVYVSIGSTAVSYC